MMKLLLASSLVLVLSSPVASQPQDRTPVVPAGSDALAALPPEERAIHQELIAFRIGIQEAFNRMGASAKPDDMAALLEFAHPDVILTAMTGESVRGKAEVMAYFRREMVDEGHSLTSMHSVFEADHLSILLRPDLATNRGTAHGTFVFTDGTVLPVDTRWTATMVKHDGRWTIAAFQFAPSVFDNPVTNAYRAWIYKAAVIAGVAGMVLGLVIGLLLTRRKARTSAA
jgi:ketosteroid isomerase-like protein